MQRCLRLAAQGLGRTRPNPLVGCVVVKNGIIISEGYHQQFGHNHAERNALLRCVNGSSGSRYDDKDVFRGATLYVNLEPCSHYGHTPPCADLIIEKGIKRVVCCNDDPNSLVDGKGFEKLQHAGIEVKRHVLEKEGRELNRRFFTYMEQHRPYVILKWAESADGYMAPCGDSPYWLTTPIQDRINHKWRTEEAAIVVGSETYLRDKPRLNARHFCGNNPQPVLIDRRCRVNTLPKNWMRLTVGTVKEVLQELYKAHLQSVIVEGGRKVLDAFIASGVYDEVRVLRSKALLGNGLPAPKIPVGNGSRLTVIEA